MITHTFRKRVLRPIALTAATIVLALVIVRLLHATDLGIRLLDSIPPSLWRHYHHAIGLDASAGVESISDADLVPVLVVCLAVSAACVVLVTRALQSNRRSSLPPG